MYQAKKIYTAINYILILASIISQCCPSFALTFTIPEQENIIGNIQTTTVQPGESLGDIGKKFDVGVYEMIEANPELDPWTPQVDSMVIIPTQFILPAGKRTGIIINLAEMRLYYYHPKTNLVTTYPIGIGRKGWVTPLMEAKVLNKQYNPTWQPPISIIKEHAINGDPLPTTVPPGPRNPLGEFAIYLSNPGYLIHGTNRPGGIGLRTTSGCIRLFPEDIKSLYNLITIGTPVKIIHEPYKIGIQNNNIYIETHEPLSDPYYNREPITTVMQKAIENANFISTININLLTLQDELQKSTKTSSGYPVLIPMSATHSSDNMIP
jgi:L,D-transpeptidase ErfK/SrfK